MVLFHMLLLIIFTIIVKYTYKNKKQKLLHKGKKNLGTLPDDGLKTSSIFRTYFREWNTKKGSSARP